MKLLPYDNYILITKLSVEEVKFQLQQNIETGNYFKRHFTSDKIYEGYISNDKFQIQMITPGRSPAKAIVNGAISTDLGKTKIQITIASDALRIVIYAVLFLFFLIALITSINSFAKHDFDNDNLAALVTLFIFNFIFRGLFKLHVQFIKDNLKEIFSADEIRSV